MTEIAQTTKKQSYAGVVPGLPMTIPRNTVLLVYGPIGQVTITMGARGGMNPWVMNLAPYGQDTVVPVDGRLWGTISASGPGTVQYVYFPRDLTPAFRLDTVSPLLGGSPQAYNGSSSVVAPISGVWIVELNNGVSAPPEGAIVVTNDPFYAELNSESGSPWAPAGGQVNPYEEGFVIANDWTLPVSIGYWYYLYDPVNKVQLNTVGYIYP